MGAFDQFRDQSDKQADQARATLGNKRRKGMEAEDPERMDPENARQNPPRRDSDVEDRARRRADEPLSGMDDNDWT